VQLAPDAQAHAGPALALAAQLATAGVDHALLFTGADDDAAAPGLLDEIAPVAAPAPPSLIARLDETPPASRLAVIADHVQREVERILGITAPARAPTTKGFHELGMDSLMAVDLKNRLQRAAGRPLLSTLAFDHPSIAALTAYLATELLGGPVAAAPSAPTNLELVAVIAALPDNELASVIDDELARLLPPAPRGRA
jgi:acyl carrier protein